MGLGPVVGRVASLGVSASAPAPDSVRVTRPPLRCRSPNSAREPNSSGRALAESPRRWMQPLRGLDGKGSGGRLGGEVGVGQVSLGRAYPVGVRLPHSDSDPTQVAEC